MARNRIVAGIDKPSLNGDQPKAPVCVLEQPTQATELDLPPLSEEDKRALASFQARQQVLRDLTLGCIDSNHTGAYIFGPPGVSKTYTTALTPR